MLDPNGFASMTLQGSAGANYYFNGAPDTDGVHYDVTVSDDADGVLETDQYNPADYYPPDTTTQSSAIRPFETCTAGGYCQWAPTVQQSATIMKVAAVGFTIASFWAPPGPAKAIAQTAAVITGLAAADFTQQSAQQKKKRNNSKQ